MNTDPAKSRKTDPLFEAQSGLANGGKQNFSTFQQAKTADVYYRAMLAKAKLKMITGESVDRKQAGTHAFNLGRSLRDLFGCTDRAHAEREGHYMCACNRYRRKYITFSTELEGLIPTYGDLISVTHDLCEWGQGGEVLAMSGKLLKLSESLNWRGNEPRFICFRRRDGSMSDTYEVKRGAVDGEVVLQQLLKDEIYIGTAMEQTHFAFGCKGNVSMLAKVIGVRPRGDTVEISCVNESEEVYKT